MLHRYFFQIDPNENVAIGNEYALDEKESHHALHVMRLQVGDSITLFDGHGFEYESTISATSRKQISVEIVDKLKVDRELPHKLVIAVPIPKADRQKFLVEKLTELGVGELVFINTERSSVQSNEKTIAKLTRLVIESSKQCRRNQLMQISNGGKLESFLQNDAWNDFRKLFAHPAEDEINFDPLERDTKHPKNAVVIIGPEGGFSEQEAQMMKQKQWQELDLGKTILRMETAAMVAATLMR